MISIVIEDMQRVRNDYEYLRTDEEMKFLLDAWIETLIEFQKVE